MAYRRRRRSRRPFRRAMRRPGRRFRGRRTRPLRIGYRM